MLFNKQKKVAKYVSDLMQCAIEGRYILSKKASLPDIQAHGSEQKWRESQLEIWENRLRMLQIKVVGLGKENLANYSDAALWLSTDSHCFGGNSALMKILSDIAKERLNAPRTCPCSSGNICLHGNQNCSMPSVDYYPLCTFMKGSFFTEYERGSWEWNHVYGKKNQNQ